MPFTSIRLIICGAIAAVGGTNVALLHCESVVSSVKSVFESGDNKTNTKTFIASFLSSLESLELRLRGHPNPVDQRRRKGALVCSNGHYLQY